MAPTFSIIIPVYNVAPYLAECLDSVRAQTYADWEALCVDDGSSDASSTLLDTYARLDPRIHITHQRNAGVSIARNTALYAAKGRYLSFLDGDDLIAVNWFSTAVRLLEETGADLIRLRARTFAEETPIDRNGDAYTIYSGKFEVMNWGWETYPIQGWSCLNFVRRRAIVGSIFPKGMRIYEDAIFCLGILPCICVAVQGEYAGYFYRQRLGSAVTHRVSVSECAGVIRQFNELACRDKVECKYVNRAIISMLFWWASTIIERECVTPVRDIIKYSRECGTYSGVSDKRLFIFCLRFFEWTGNTRLFRWYFYLRRLYGRMRSDT